MGTKWIRWSKQWSTRGSMGTACSKYGSSYCSPQQYEDTSCYITERKRRHVSEVGPASAWPSYWYQPYYWTGKLEGKHPHHVFMKIRLLCKNSWCHPMVYQPIKQNRTGNTRGAEGRSRYSCLQFIVQWSTMSRSSSTRKWQFFTMLSPGTPNSYPSRTLTAALASNPWCSEMC